MSVSITSSETINHAAPPAVDTPELGLARLPGPVIRQMPMSVTLDRSQILILASTLIGLLHFFGPGTTIAAVGLVPALLFIYNDYQNFLGLGPGGTPSTLRGYLKISYLRLWALRDPFTARKPELNSVPSKGILAMKSLPYRMGPKPRVAGIAPHRQIDQHGSPCCYQALKRSLEKLGLKNPKRFGTGRSFIEKHGLALFARHPIQTGYQGEVCHIHDAESSMHMALHPEDSKEVLQKGWGQRHPLAWKWWFLTTPVAADFVMVYAPRDESELLTVCNIIEGAIWYTAGEEVEVEVYLKSR
ncbi:hypothetical protein ACRE_041910 [Hapsidospora chrysogenum ATCC 11550]|uniref:Luciferase domain-containing protein n=1 Tax=Hapsidospora chrysogenum (strain ATCC 11550 / CBS 779.69 / DSM 880 / IAM 14645 / JCM 23072 / IMI 49137) TaxID=857340 RepID=A0A086T6M4_HAPC1|nr:hypothetical protein ACRE_041910 [Hapsidospora chrysogenum ATCC 11550]